MSKSNAFYIRRHTHMHNAYKSPSILCMLMSTAIFAVIWTSQFRISFAQRAAHCPNAHRQTDRPTARHTRAFPIRFICKAKGILHLLPVPASRRTNLTNKKKNIYKFSFVLQQHYTAIKRARFGIGYTITSHQIVHVSILYCVNVRMCGASQCDTACRRLAY